ncbi:MAG: type II toxin-antitoxin system RelE/ParE family toxin [Gemmatimonadales bacterium]
MTIRVEEYLRADGANPFRRWFDRLDPMAAVKVTVALGRLGAGHRSAIKWLRGIGEYRIDWGPGYRIYLAQDGPDLILLLGGGTKRRQQADLTRATELHQEYQARKGTQASTRRK